VVREHEELVFISESGMVQRTGVRGISRYGRMSQGVKVMNVKDEDRVSAVALVMESKDEAETTAAVGAVDGASSDGELSPEAAIDPEAAVAADPDGEVPGEPDEVDLDETDGPPTPGA
jgi:DNA gyrase subunit A